MPIFGKMSTSIREIQADFALLAPQLGHQLPIRYEQHGREEACNEIRSLIDSDDRFNALDYEWAADPDAYARSHEAVLQLEVIRALAGIPSGHPVLSSTKPIVVRLDSAAGYQSMSLRGRRCDFIVISGGYLGVLRSVAHVMTQVHEEFADQQPAGASASIEQLLTAPCSSLIAGLSNDPAAVLDKIGWLQLQVVALDREVPPPYEAPLLTDRIQKGVEANDALWLHVATMYGACDRFILFHELGHILNGDAFDVARSLSSELMADWAAMSLCLARQEIAFRGKPRETEAIHMLLDIPLAAVWIQIMRLMRLLCVGYRVVAAVSDLSVSALSGSLDSEAEALNELELRLPNLCFSLVSFGLRDLWSPVMRVIQGYESLVQAARMLVLRQAGDDWSFVAVPRTDFGDAMERLLRYQQGEEWAHRPGLMPPSSGP